MKRLEKGYRIKVLVTDDHELFRTGVSNSLDKFNDIEVIGFAQNGKELLEKLQYLTPDIITLDIQMPVMDGLEVLPLIRKRFPSVKVIILTFINDVSVITKMMSLGARAYLTSDSGGDTIYKALLACYENDFFINKTVREALLATYYPDSIKNKGFTEKELRILKLLADRKSEKEIADDVNLSPRTVIAIIDKLKNKTKTCSIETLIAFIKKEKIIA